MSSLTTKRNTVKLSDIFGGSTSFSIGRVTDDGRHILNQIFTIPPPSLKKRKLTPAGSEDYYYQGQSSIVEEILQEGWPSFDAGDSFSQSPDSENCNGKKSRRYLSSVGVLHNFSTSDCFRTNCCSSGSLYGTNFSRSLLD